MFSLRSLILILAVWLAVVLIRRLLAARKPPLSRDASLSDQPMVRCAHCGLYLPEAEALHRGEQAFCCSAHRDLGPKSG